MQWNRGAYLVNGLGHCGGYHTPKNPLGADKSKQELHSGKLDNWVAPDLTSSTRLGLGEWSVSDVAEFLATGRNAHSAGGGPMAPVVSYSTFFLNDADRRAIAVYLKSQPASPSPDSSAPNAGAKRSVAQSDPAGLEHLILAGTQIGVSASRPSALSMPSFAWKLSDQEIADVSTYIRNSWGNQALDVSEVDVKGLRKTLDLQTVHYTDNTGDQR